jgi:AcrR family transcriptional regulator
VLAAAREEFAERGYTAATVSRIAERADVAVQTLYSAWGSKRALLRAVMETAVTGTDTPLEPDHPPTSLIDQMTLEDAEDPVQYLTHLAHRFRLLAERADLGWSTYRDAAATDPDVANDWHQLQMVRRRNFHLVIGAIPPASLQPGLIPATAADTAWVIASPESFELLVRRAGYNTDEFEQWVAHTLIGALLPERAAT